MRMASNPVVPCSLYMWVVGIQQSDAAEIPKRIHNRYMWVV